MTPHVLIDTDDFHAVEPGRVSDQHASTFGEDRVVRGVPRDCESFGDARDGEVLHDETFQRPPQSTRDSVARGCAALLVS